MFHIRFNVKFEYFATNRVEVPPEKRRNYLSLCFFYVTGQFNMRGHLNSLPRPIQAKMLVDRNMDFHLKDEKEKEWMASPKGFSTMMYGEIGFAANMVFDGTDFKYRLYCADDLKERNLDILFEPMRLYEKSGPDSLGLQAVKEDEKLEPIESPFSWNDIKNNYKKRLEFEMKEAKETLGWKLPKVDPENDSCGELEEYMYNVERKKDAEWKLHIERAVRRNMERGNGWRESLKKQSDLFDEVRADLAKKLGMPRLLNVAYGTTPFLQLDNLDDSIASCWPVRYALPSNDGFNDRTRALVDAEVYVRPEGECSHIVSFFPHTSLTDEINSLNEELLKEDGPMRAMLAHEILESFMYEKFRPMSANPLQYMLDSGYQQSVDMENASLMRERHNQLNRMLDRLGYSDCTETLLKRYSETADAAMEAIGKKDEKIHARFKEKMNDKNSWRMMRTANDRIRAAEVWMGWKYGHMLALKQGCGEWLASIQEGKIPESGMKYATLGKMDAVMKDGMDSEQNDEADEPETEDDSEE